MLQYVKSLGLALLLSAGVGSVGQAASFDCNKATTETEIAICSDPELSALDDLMANVWERYKEKLNNAFPLGEGSITNNTLILPGDALQQQRDWLSRTHLCGGDSECIYDNYKNRILFISDSNFRVSGAMGKEYFRRYFERSGDVCEPTKLSVDAFYEESVGLCYEIIPQIRNIDIFAASGVSIISYYELAPGYYDCASVNLYIMDMTSKGEITKTWKLRYSYSEWNALSEGLRKEHDGDEILNLAIVPNDGFEFENYRVGCGMYNLDVSGGRGFGGAL